MGRTCAHIAVWYEAQKSAVFRGPSWLMCILLVVQLAHTTAAAAAAIIAGSEMIHACNRHVETHTPQPHYLLHYCEKNDNV